MSPYPFFPTYILFPRAILWPVTTCYSKRQIYLPFTITLRGMRTKQLYPHNLLCLSLNLFVDSGDIFVCQLLRLTLKLLDLILRDIGGF